MVASDWQKYALSSWFFYFSHLSGGNLSVSFRRWRLEDNCSGSMLNQILSWKKVLLSDCLTWTFGVGPFGSFWSIDQM